MDCFALFVQRRRVGSIGEHCLRSFRKAVITEQNVSFRVNRMPVAILRTNMQRFVRKSDRNYHRRSADWVDISGEIVRVWLRNRVLKSLIDER